MNAMGPPTCQDCRDRRRTALRRRQQDTRRERRSRIVCARCGKEVPYDPGNPYRKLHDECRDIPAPRMQRQAEARKNRVCRKCGTGEPLNKKGPPVCASCYAHGVLKYRNCVECGGRFKTRNNSTRCSKCQWEKQRKQCPDCGEKMDPRAKRCRSCNDKLIKGPNNYNWRGGRKRHSGGYILVYMPDHPRAARGYVPEHTLVMEEMIGRYLLPGETAHHKNGVRTDNRPENLELWTRSQPSGQRVTDLVAWAHEIIARYGALNLAEDHG